MRLVVIDSIAALFRCEFGASDSVLKARYLQMFGAQLHSLSTRFSTPVVCINQVWHQNCFSLYGDYFISCCVRVCKSVLVRFLVIVFNSQVSLNN